MDSERRIRRLQAHALQLPAFIAGHEGRVVQKGSLSAPEESQLLQEEIGRTRRLFETKFAPRAAVGLSIHVAVAKGQAPSLESILKFYVDQTKGSLVEDDRQIEYIDAHLSSADSKGHAAGTVYLTFDRLTRLRRRWDFAWKHRELVEDEMDCGLHYDPELDWHRDLSRVFGKRETDRISQSRILEGIRLDWHARPLSRSPRNDLERELARFEQPFTVTLGAVPGQNEEGSLTAEATESYRTFARQHPHLIPLQVPVSVDIQVWTEGKLCRDLDNILGSLLPPFREELVGARGRIFGVRIYANRSTDGSPPPMVRLKLLPMNAIVDWEARVDAILTAARRGGGWLGA